jgi:DNA-binding LytR/AlgR family response regulator
MKPLVARLSMKTLEENFPAKSFLRIHKSYIVAKRAITAIQKNLVYLNEMELPVGDLYREQVQQYVGL